MQHVQYSVKSKMSKFQDRVVELLRVSLNGMLIKTEVPVDKLFSEYPSGRDRYDIVVPYLKLIVECHGRQHDELVSFGKQDSMDLVGNFHSQKYRDSRKEDIASTNCWHYAVIWQSNMTDNDKEDTNTIMRIIGWALGLQ